MSHQLNLERIKAVHQALGDLQSQVVFVGGSTVSLYAEHHAYEFRGTDDVDVIVEIAKYPEHVQFEEQIRKKGFADDQRMRGRYKVHDITVDIIPTIDVSMGFSNLWYPDGFKNAVQYSIDQDTTVKILSPPYLIATKLEAFKNRGNDDGRTSQDFEDIVYVMENRRSIWEEMEAAPDNVKQYLKEEFTTLLKNKYINEWIECHVEFYSPPSTVFILAEMKRFVA